MDRNSLVVIIFSGFLFFVLGGITATQLKSPLPISDTMVGAIAGGFLAGLFGILAAGYTIYHNKQGEKLIEKKTQEVLIHSIITKLIDLNEGILKCQRHIMINDISTKVSFTNGSKTYSFSKPLEGDNRKIIFSIDERTFILRVYKAELFSRMNDIVGISRNFSFLSKRHTKAYYELMDEVFATKHERKGYVRTTELDINSVKLMAMMDVDGALNSFIADAAPELRSLLTDLIAISNADTSVSIKYEITDTPPSAENHKRTDY
jgi:hypothetical protein